MRSSPIPLAGDHASEEAALQRTAPTIALIGNPNTGKTALFNALTGFRRHVANYPGVTVEFAHGPIRGSDPAMNLLDLPGTYSLAARSPDEMVVCDALCGRLRGQRRPDAILAIVDASNLMRNLYLVSQLLEVGVPVVLALNMMDVARARGIDIDIEALAARLGVPVIPIVATRPETVRPLVAALAARLDAAPPAPQVELPPELRAEVDGLCQSAHDLPRAEALQLLAANGASERRFEQIGGEPRALEAARQRLRAAEIDPAAAQVRARYAWVNRVLDGVIQRRIPDGRSWSTRIDHVLTHRIAGAIVLLTVLYTLFYAIYAGSAPLVDGVETVFAWLGVQAGSILPAGALRSVVVDGVFAGVGGLLAFLPQILILFLFLAILEDCGYLSRAAFMVDRLMRPLGLSGRAFIPLLSSFACAVPAILGTRAIADRRERAITILMTPFMSCSARLPVYVLLIGALIPHKTWLGGWLRLDALTMLAMYLVGALVSIPVAFVLKRTVFRGPPAGFLMELPSYKVPHVRVVWQRVYLAGRSFVVRAGTIILLVNLGVWALAYFPRSESVRADVEKQRTAAGWSDARFQNELAGAYLRHSYLGQMGQAVEPAIRPIGWDWRIGVGVIASFPAREVIVATLGTVFNLGSDEDEASTSLRDAVRQMTWEDSGRRLFTVPVALSVMVFFALCAQCSATLVTIGRELGSWSWPVAVFIGMTTLAYAAAWGTAAGARALGW